MPINGKEQNLHLNLHPREHSIGIISCGERKVLGVNIALLFAKSKQVWVACALVSWLMTLGKVSGAFK